MRKSADAAILMQLSSNYTLLFPRQLDWEDFVQQKPMTPFATDVIEFLNALSGNLLKDKTSRAFPDVITFAFFCRKANLMNLKAQYTSPEVLRLGRGLLFHIAPSNVPINFGYSLVAGLLAGNNNIVRVSSKQFPQVDLIIRRLYELIADEQFSDIANRIALVRYDRASDANAFFSSLCNVRVIWGGDATIATLRQNAIPPRSFDVCFADRYSIAALNPEVVASATEKQIRQLAESFYNDTYLFDQNACSAPHAIFWIRDTQLKEAQNRFWKAVHEYSSQRYKLQAVMSVDKLTAFYRQAVCMNVEKEEMPDNVVVRANLKELPQNIDEFRCACGYFSEYIVDSLDEIGHIITTKYQTLGYYGFTHKELTDFVIQNRFKGLDRIVPIGETTAFSLTWDGYNLIDTFSRIPSIL